MNTAPTHQTDFIRLLTKHQPGVRAYILSMIPSATAADDILQETNVVLWQKADQYDPEGNFGAWARRIAYFQTLQFIEKDKRHVPVGWDTDLFTQIADECASKFGELDERRNALKSCIESLSPADQEILTSRYTQQQPLNAVASKLGRSEGALKQVLFRIRKSLKRCISVKVNQVQAT